jgi:hypothetical protein
VLSLYKAGALEMILEQLDSYKLDITAIQELRWLGKRVMGKGSMLYSTAVRRRVICLQQALLSVKKLSILS